MRKISQDFILLTLLFLFSLLIIFPYFKNGYFPTHDGEWAVVRLTDMYREVKDLQIPPRFSGNLNAGYGYPLFNFAYPLPYYSGIILLVAGFGFITSIKILFASSVFLSGVSMFFLSKSIWKNSFAGFTSALLYMYLPYRLVDLYVRGSIGESMAFILFPAILLFLLKAINEKKVTANFIFAVVSYGALILTHNIMAVLFTGVLTLFILVTIFLKRVKNVILVVLFYIFSYALSAFFWLPALLEKKYILLSKIPIADRSLYFVTLERFFFSKWGYGVPTDVNSFTYQLGWPHIMGLIIVVVSLGLFRKKTNEHTKTAVLLIGILLLFFFLLFSPSQALWERIPLLSEINYPWILLGILGFLVSLTVGYLSSNKLLRYASIALCIISVVLYLPFAKPQSFNQRTDDYYMTNDATTTSSKELMPLWVKTFPLERPKEKVVLAKGNGIINNIFYNSKKVSFNAEITTPSAVRINTLYYPGWIIKANGKEVDVSYKNDFGVMDIFLEKGNYFIEAIFTETKIRLFADIVSLATLCVLCFMLFREIKKKNAHV